MNHEPLLSDTLTVEEMALLHAAGKDATEFVALMQHAASLSAQSGRDMRTGQSVLLFTVQVVIPTSVLAIPTTGILTPDGKQAISDKVASAIPAPPVLRLLVDRRMLTDEAKAMVQSLENRPVLRLPADPA
jgi:hypothetical protein